MAAGPGALLILTACLGFDWLGTADERRDASDRLRALPFPVTHDRPSVITNDDPRPIVSVTISLAQRMGNRDGDEWCRAANDRAPDLTVIADAATIRLTSWSWRKQDLVLLAQLLDSWGRALHAVHGIRSVDVCWAERRGPPLGI
jgi:hypothetical protein